MSGSSRKAVELSSIALVVGEGFQLINQFADEVAQIKRLEDQIGAAAFDAGKVEEIVDETQQVLRAFADITDRLFLFVGHRAVNTVEEQFGVTDDGVDRRAKFVAAVGKKLGFEPVHIFQMANLLMRHCLGFVLYRIHEHSQLDEWLKPARKCVAG